MKRAVALMLFLAFAAPAAAQSVYGDRFVLRSGTCQISSGSGVPSGGADCDTYLDTATGDLYTKQAGTWKKVNTYGTVTSVGVSLANVTFSGPVTTSGTLAGTWTNQSPNTLFAGPASGAAAAPSFRAMALADLPTTSAGSVLISGAAASWSTHPVLAAVYGNSSLSVGGTGATCAGYPSCEANAFTLDSTVLVQRLKTDTAYQSRWHIGTDGGHLSAYNASAYLPLKIDGAPVQIGGGGLHVGTTSISDPGVGNAGIDGYIGKPGYVSQATGWRVDDLGAADFRYLYTDELHAKVFVADLEQALAGGQIISKSVAMVGAAFTVPAPGSISTLTVKDLPSAAGMAVFESGDYVRVREFSRASGSLSITDAWGRVTGYADAADGLQTWTFTRLVSNGGAMTTGAVIAVDSVVLDYGVSGNGFYEVNAIDGLYGVNSPYMQIVTWAGDSPIAANQTLRTRCGNLRGITSVTGEFGCVFGTYAATGGRFIKASSEGLDIHGVDLKLWNSTTNVLHMERTTPYFAMGSPAPTTYASGTGLWSGLDAGTYKFRVGDPEGQGIDWNGSTLTITGDVVVEGTLPDADNAAALGGVAASVFIAAKDRTNLGLDSYGNPILPAAAHPSGSGLFLGSDYLGYYTSGAWKTYMDSSGNFYLGGTSGALQWNGTALTITATLAGNGSAITSITGTNITTASITATQIAANTITASQIAAGTITATELAADSVTSAKIVAGTIVAADIATGTITGTQIAGHTISASEIVAGTITTTEIAANTITAADIAAGTITTTELAANTITAGDIAAGTITGTEIAADAITSAKIAAGTIVASDIASDTITASQIAAGTITATELAADSVTSAKIEAGTIVASDIAAGTITADRLNVTTLSAIAANLGTVTAGSLDVASGANSIKLGVSYTYPFELSNSSLGTYVRVGFDGVIALNNSISAPDATAHLRGLLIDDGGDNFVTFSHLAGGGTQVLCIDNSGVVSAGCVAPEVSGIAALRAEVDSLRSLVAELQQLVSRGGWR